jgi:hypothetical protein
MPHRNKEDKAACGKKRYVKKRIELLAYKKQWYQDNKEKIDADRLRRHGTTRAEVTATAKAQRGCCKICKRDASLFYKGLCIDHDHKTNQFRGLLCHHCNVGLGHFQDDPELLAEAIKYLLDKRPAAA